MSASELLFCSPEAFCSHNPGLDLPSSGWSRGGRSLPCLARREELLLQHIAAQLHVYGRGKRSRGKVAAERGGRLGPPLWYFWFLPRCFHGSPGFSPAHPGQLNRRKVPRGQFSRSGVTQKGTFLSLGPLPCTLRACWALGCCQLGRQRGDLHWSSPDSPPPAPGKLQQKPGRRRGQKTPNPCPSPPSPV